MLRPPRVCCAHTKALKEKKKEGKTFFFGSWSQPTLLQLLALHFHGRLDRINRPLLRSGPLQFLAQHTRETSVAVYIYKCIYILSISFSSFPTFFFLVIPKTLQYSLLEIFTLQQEVFNFKEEHPHFFFLWWFDSWLGAVLITLPSILLCSHFPVGQNAIVITLPPCRKVINIIEHHENSVSDQLVSIVSSFFLIVHLMKKQMRKRGGKETKT